MDNNTLYPRYLSYDKRKLPPSVLLQEYPLPSLAINEVYYPPNKYLIPYFSSEKEFQLFGASQFCNFLSDTIDVEHGLVIPAIATLRWIPFKLPAKPKQDLFKTATDECHHAEQSLAFLTVLENHFGLSPFSGSLKPLFIRRLEHQRSRENNPVHKQLITVLNGIVTETRISVELSKFAINHELSDAVKRICLAHALDEVVHSSQFQALGYWLWEEFNEELKTIASKFFINSTIARSLPDIDSIIISFSKATGCTIRDAAQVVLSAYNENFLLEEMTIAAEPTLKFLQKLGIENYLSIKLEVEKERENLYRELLFRRKEMQYQYNLVK